MMAYVGALTLTAAAACRWRSFIAPCARQMIGGPLLAIFLARGAPWSIAQAPPALFGARAVWPADYADRTVASARRRLRSHRLRDRHRTQRPGATAGYGLAAFEVMVGLLVGVDTVEDMGLVGPSSAIAALRDLIRSVARMHLPVLVLGPSGTGKELVARGDRSRSIPERFR